MQGNGKQVGGLIVTTPNLLSAVRQIVYNKKSCILIAIAFSPHGKNQQFIRFLEPTADTDCPRESVRNATDVTEEDCLALVKAVEEESGLRFSIKPVNQLTENGKTISNPDIVEWITSIPEPPHTGATPPPLVYSFDPE